MRQWEESVQITRAFRADPDQRAAIADEEGRL
jgi:hypothetical protein